jgi:hypothetical protein
MAAPSYLRRIARAGGEPGRTPLAPPRLLFRPSPFLTGQRLDSEAGFAMAPAIADGPLEPVTKPSTPRPAIVGPDLPLAAAPPEPQSEQPKPISSGAVQRKVTRSARQASTGSSVHRQIATESPASAATPLAPTNSLGATRTPAPSPASIRDAERPSPISLSRVADLGQDAIRAVMPTPDVARDAHSAVVLHPTPARRTALSSDSHGFDRPNLSAPGEPASRTASTENSAAREERIQLMPPVIRTLPGAGNRTATASAVEGGVHIGSLEVHVGAPPAPTGPAAPPAATRAAAPVSRAAGPLARGFATFGLVQS